MSVPNIPLMLSPCVIEQTNKTTPNYCTTLLLQPNTDSMELLLQTFQNFGEYQFTCIDWIFKSDTRKPVSSNRITIGYEDAVILRNKLNQFISTYEDSHDYSFIMTKDEPFISKKDSFLNDYDIPIPEEELEKNV